MGDADIEDGGKIEKAKQMTRQASKSVCKVSKKVSKKSAGYTKLIINSIAGALPDSEIMIVALMAATVFIRAEEAHLKGKNSDTGLALHWPLLYLLGISIF